MTLTVSSTVATSLTVLASVDLLRYMYGTGFALGTENVS
jgi:hypothetical protein